MGDIINGNKFEFGDNSRMINIEMKNYFGSDSNKDENNPDSDIRETEEAEYEEVNSTPISPAPVDTEAQDVNKQPINLVFKKFHEGKEIDFYTIRKYIEEKLVNDIKHKYEWYAAYRIVDDLRLLEDLKLSSFADQMNKWYPDAKVPCEADALGDYATGPTGKNFILWDEEKFMTEKKNNQTKKGFRKLWNLCHEIKDSLKIIPTLQPRMQ